MTRDLAHNLQLHKSFKSKRKWWKSALMEWISFAVSNFWVCTDAKVDFQPWSSTISSFFFWLKRGNIRVRKKFFQLWGVWSKMHFRHFATCNGTWICFKKFVSHMCVHSSKQICSLHACFYFWCGLTTMKEKVKTIMPIYTNR